MASLSGKDFVRDLDYSPSLLTGSASMALAVLVAALDSPAPAPPRPNGALPFSTPSIGAPTTMPGGARQQPPVTITGVAPWATPDGGARGISMPFPPRGKGGFATGGTGMPMTVAPFRGSNAPMTVMPGFAGVRGGGGLRGGAKTVC